MPGTARLQRNNGDESKMISSKFSHNGMKYWITTKNFHTHPCFNIGHQIIINFSKTATHLKQMKIIRL